jgi:hypothetical protein
VHSMLGWISPGIWKDQDSCPGCLPRAQVRSKRGMDVSGGAHARDTSATLGSLGPCEMLGAGVNPVRHVPQSVPTGSTSGVRGIHCLCLGKREWVARLQIPVGRWGTLGTTRLAELLRSKALRTIWLAELLRPVHFLALASERTVPGLPSSWALPPIGLVA